MAGPYPDRLARDKPPPPLVGPVAVVNSPAAMILCCGEALIDMMPVPTATGQIAYFPARRRRVQHGACPWPAGAQGRLLTGLSRDPFGRQLADAAGRSKVDLGHVIFSDRLSTLAFVQLTDGQAGYSFMDENSAGRMILPADLPELADEVEVLVFGGISLAVSRARMRMPNCVRGNGAAGGDGRSQYPVRHHPGRAAVSVAAERDAGSCGHREAFGRRSDMADARRR